MLCVWNSKRIVCASAAYSLLLFGSEVVSLIFVVNLQKHDFLCFWQIQVNNPQIRLACLCHASSI